LEGVFDGVRRSRCCCCFFIVAAVGSSNLGWLHNLTKILRAARRFPCAANPCLKRGLWLYKLTSITDIVELQLLGQNGGVPAEFSEAVFGSE
jgi:hypothetical protein